MKTFGSWSGGSFKAARSVITGMFWSWARNATGAASEPASATENGSFNINEVLQTFWTGAKWSVWNDLPFRRSYYQVQNDYNFTTCVMPFSPSDIWGEAAQTKSKFQLIKKFSIYEGTAARFVVGGGALLYLPGAPPMQPRCGGWCAPVAPSHSLRTGSRSIASTFTPA